MRRTSWVAVGLLVVLLAPLASADLLTRIELEDAGALGESDLGIKVGACLLYTSPSPRDS